MDGWGGRMGGQGEVDPVRSQVNTMTRAKISIALIF